MKTTLLKAKVTHVRLPASGLIIDSNEAYTLQDKKTDWDDKQEVSFSFEEGSISIVFGTDADEDGTSWDTELRGSTQGFLSAAKGGLLKELASFGRNIDPEELLAYLEEEGWLRYALWNEEEKRFLTLWKGKLQLGHNSDAKTFPSYSKAKAYKVPEELGTFQIVTIAVNPDPKAKESPTPKAAKPIRLKGSKAKTVMDSDGFPQWNPAATVKRRKIGNAKLTSWREGRVGSSTWNITVSAVVFPKKRTPQQLKKFALEADIRGGTCFDSESAQRLPRPEPVKVKDGWQYVWHRNDGTD